VNAATPALTVPLGDRSYPIHIGDGLLGDAALLAAVLPARRVAVVTNDIVGPLYLPRLQATWAAAGATPLLEIVLPDGERHKTLPTVSRILDTLVANRFARDDLVVALGGGVVGDMAGFAAACYQRGVAFIQVPTTLLAQVDSSVGGKTGVNHPKAKNMIGAFHQPNAVIIDTETLATLPDRELSAGIAEVYKYGLIRDAAFFDWIEASMGALLARDGAALAEAIERSCRSKADVVGADERESGNRALLNLGHTFGHAIETGAGYGAWLHGEAIAVGMCMAADLSHRLGWLGAPEVERIRALTLAARLPIAPPPGLGPDRFLELMAVDKKVLEGRLRLVLLKAIGEAVVTADFPASALQATLDACCGPVRS
jgi:3-dehydroquinate synthase